MWEGDDLTFAFQWQRCTAPEEQCADIAGADGPALALGRADVGKVLRVVVTATNADGSASATSATSGPVKVTVPQLRGQPVARAGSVLKGLGLKMILSTGALSKCATVLNQSPEAGATVEAGSTVRLTVSKSPFPGC